ncbi:GerMN domain-containing protein [Bacillus solitudinis]|uniref:GerMN domain-containing protein n=1 Tax=Bacillus solitudinis TaxID=2014074 RepID=UPI001D0D61D4|nr:GerMN domain-containing protein [Bacillus solitudinis]
MKKPILFSIICLFLLLLVACGQSEEPINSDHSTSGVVTEENTDLVESETTENDELDETPEVDSETTESGNETVDSNAVEEELATPVELFFADDNVMDIYRVERMIEASDEELFKATLNAWIEGPNEEGLVSLIPEDVIVQSVEEDQGVAHVSFSPALLEAQVGSGVEEMLLQQIALTMKQFGFNETQILIDGEVVPELFGHMDTSSPIVANDPKDYKKVE